MDITINDGTPCLAFCQGTSTADERSKWVDQLQIPMIYCDGGHFMLTYRTPTGTATRVSLHGPLENDAFEQARSILAKNPECVVINNKTQAVQEYNERESANLMNIVAVVYGVALTIALSNRPDLLIHPLTPANRIPGLALLATGLLTAFTFYSYVLSVGGDRPYCVTWTTSSSKPMGIFRFFADLVLACLYVHLLFAADSVDAKSATTPKLAELGLAFLLVFAGAVIVWLFRGLGFNAVAIGALFGFGGLYAWAYFTTATRGTDFSIGFTLLGAVLLYGTLSHWYPYHRWKYKKKRAYGPPRTE